MGVRHAVTGRGIGATNKYGGETIYPFRIWQWNAVGGRHDDIRNKAVKRATQAVGMIGMIPTLTVDQLRDAIGLAVDGIIGYYGRAVMMTKKNTDAIEAAIREVLAMRGYGDGKGMHIKDRRQGGMGWYSVHRTFFPS